MELAPAPSDVRVLAPDGWRTCEAAHEARVDTAVGQHLARRRAGRPHPVEDFLFSYYSFRPAQLRRWHPGVGVVLAGAAGTPRESWRYYMPAGGDGLTVDVAAFRAERGATARYVRDLLTRTAARPMQLGCFGLHEWAMVYRQGAEEVRHAWPLRLGSTGTDEVVESLPLRCSHVDAFRFFTAEARPRNALRPTRENQVELEQPGCLHAGMDVYKWAYKLAPAVPSELVMDCFHLARDLRELDMRASPYDLSDLGYEPVAVETPDGRAEYARAQRAFAERAGILRHRLVDVCDALLARS